jgi:hypothetical protein
MFLSIFFSPLTRSLAKLIIVIFGLVPYLTLRGIISIRLRKKI